MEPYLLPFGEIDKRNGTYRNLTYILITFVIGLRIFTITGGHLPPLFPFLPSPWDQIMEVVCVGPIPAFLIFYYFFYKPFKKQGTISVGDTTVQIMNKENAPIAVINIPDITSFIMYPLPELTTGAFGKKEKNILLEIKITTPNSHHQLTCDLANKAIYTHVETFMRDTIPAMA